MSPSQPQRRPFPITRYQGSKRKLLEWIAGCLQPLRVNHCLDAFSGTSSVSYLLKQMGKQVTANDYLRFNQSIARALVVNESTTLPLTTAAQLWEETPGRTYDDFIERRFSGLFYPNDENRWLDRVVQNIHALPSHEHRDLALFALFQACLAKRPFNLFHRANLNLRTAQVKRSFGNKATWDAPFSRLFTAALQQANAAVFASERQHRALCQDCLELSPGYDLVYLDPPYLNASAKGVDYLDFYHFLEGLTQYEQWPDHVNDAYKHRPYRRRPSCWLTSSDCRKSFETLVDTHRHSVLAISYRGDGTPTVEEIVQMLRRHGRPPVKVHAIAHKYALSRAPVEEVLFVSEP